MQIAVHPKPTERTKDAALKQTHLQKQEKVFLWRPVLSRKHINQFPGGVR